MPREVTLSTLGNRSLVVPLDLLELWEWHNGTASAEGTTLGDMWLIPGFYLLSVDEAASRFEQQVADPRWDKTWLPVLADDGGDYLAVRCAAGDQQGNVHRFRTDDYEVPLEYRSVERMAATFAAAYEDGAFYVDPDGWLEQDDTAFHSLASALNADVPSWRELLT